MNRLRDLLSRSIEQLKKLIPRGIALFQENNMSIYSGYATLFIVTSVFPCIILIISIVNLLPGYSAEDVVGILFQILPDLEPVKELVLSLMEDLEDQSGGLLASVAAVTTLWSASKGVLAIQKGLDQLDSRPQDSESVDSLPTGSEPENTEPEGIEPANLEAKKAEPADTEADGIEPAKEKSDEIVTKGKGVVNRFIKRILKRLIFTLTLIILIPALLVFEMLGDSIAEIICNIVKKINPDVLDSTLENIDSFFHASSLVVIVFALLVILQIYAHLPLVQRTLRSQIPGAILTGACWFAFTELFSFFIPRFYHASNLYGSLASLFLVLLWLRYMVMILFAGGVLNRALEEQKQ